MAVLASRAQSLEPILANPDALSRPIITYINGDISWLISFPRPASEKNTSSKFYYHAVIDPWFGQPSIVLASLFLEMGLGREPAIPSRIALDAKIIEIELAAGNALLPTDTKPAVDAVFIMAMAEHCNRESLLQFTASTPIFGVAAAASSIASQGVFDTVVRLAPCDPSKTPWGRGHPGEPLPAWLTVFPPTVTRLNNFGLALITSAHVSTGELILMAPHGIGAGEPAIKGLLALEVKMLALVAPLKDSYLFGVKTVLGVEDGLAVARIKGAKYYVRSGDFVGLRYKGVIGWSVRDVPHGLQWGIDQLSQSLGAGEIIEDPTLVEVENGGSFVLL